MGSQWPLVDETEGLAVGDHLCWTYTDRAVLEPAVVAFLEEGHRRGEQLLLVGSDPVERLVESVAGLTDRDELMRSGRLEVGLALDAYDACSARGTEAQVEQLRAATDDAVRRGRSGLRIAADVSEVGRDPRTARALLRYEQAVDALFDTAPVTAMCIYADDLPPALVGHVSLLHPLQHRSGAETALHVAVRSSRIGLVGELDLNDAPHLRHLLGDLHDVEGDDVVLDLSELTFLDVAGARVLAQVVDDFTAAGRHLQVKGARRNARRCLELFGVATSADAA